MTRAEKAEALHASGCACSQAVFGAFAAEYGVDTGLAVRLSSGLGAGIGRLQLTCGAVSGGVLALGLALGNATGAEQDKKEAAYAAAREFVAAIEAEFGASGCRELLQGNDLQTAEGKERIKAAGLQQKVCAPIIRRSVELVEAALAARGRP